MGTKGGVILYELENFTIMVELYLAFASVINCAVVEKYLKETY